MTVASYSCGTHVNNERKALDLTDLCQRDVVQHIQGAQKHGRRRVLPACAPTGPKERKDGKCC